MFFVLSGFLITTLLLERGTSLADFYRRRARRLLPALLVMLYVYLLVVRNAHAVLGVLLGVSYSQNLLLAFGVVSGPRALAHCGRWQSKNSSISSGP